MPREITIAVVDGQGGGIGKNVIAKLRKQITKNQGVTICALGTNSSATNQMIKAGADIGATGENAIVCTSARADIIIGSIAMIAANSMLGELTPLMAQAISSSRGYKILIPLNRCNLIVAAELNGSTDVYIDYAVKLAMDYLSKELV